MPRSPSRTDVRPAARWRRGRLRRILMLVLAALLVLVLVLSGVAAWSVVRAFPQTDGTLEVPGLQETVTVQRDARGVPTITAARADDLLFAQGFVHAQDRFWEMDFRRHMTSARLSELFGESQVPTDTFLRTLGWHRTAQAEVAALPAEERGYYEAYAAGVNAYLEERSGGGLGLEYSVLGLQNRGYSPEPWTPADSVAWLKAMAWDLRTNIEDETARALLAGDLDPERIADLYPGYPFDEHPVILAEEPSGAGIGDGEVPQPAGAPAEPAQPGGGTADHREPGSAAAYPEAGALFAACGLAEILAEVDALVGGQGEGIGSNSWVVSGEHTATGGPLLANDPHLGASLPSVWTQMQLRCSEVTPDCPFDVAGFSFSGLPGIVIGHNAQVAWGFTNLTTDVADLYVERVDADGYWRDGEKVPFETREETLRVAGGEDVEITVRTTGHGPIVSGLTPEFTGIAASPPTGADAGAGPGAGAGTSAGESTDAADDWSGEHALSLRWTALEAGTTAQAIFALNRARDFSDFRAAAALFDVPAQNLVYADVDGNIGYQAPGRLPIRGAGDGWMPQPGWDSAYDWQGFIPFSELPVEYNPDSGIIVTANNAIVDDAYRHPLSRDWDYGDRAARIVDLLDEAVAAGPVTGADLAAIQLDTVSPVAAPLQRAYAELTVDDPDVTEALELLAGWDGRNDADSAAAAYANVLFDRVTAALLATQGTDIPRDDQSRIALVLDQLLDDPGSPWWAGDRDALLRTAAAEAHTELVELQGEDPAGWSWGELHALTLTHGSFGESGIAPIEALFNRGPYPVGGGSGVVNATGSDLDAGFATTTVPSLRMVIDVADWDDSTWQNLTGASGHAFHPHYTDQAEPWAAGVQDRWAWSTAAVDTATEDTLTLRPR
ncbi:penicillin acylase family protein [Brevibacterium sp. NPDC049920]|uniref:penicillin acylase family protein n=1 Tax=Brevibacterium sp. NPDC049920 TaxID=3155279 RepID=UPI0033C641C5